MDKSLESQLENDFVAWMHENHPGISLSPYVTNTGVMSHTWHYNDPRLEMVRQTWVASYLKAQERFKTS